MKNTIPNHIAVIMDGNGRWARKRGLPRTLGHRSGTKATREIVKICGEIGVKFLTIYTFSSENWSRPLPEVKALMSLLVEMIRKEVSELNKNKVRLRAIGEIDKLPPKAKQELIDGIAQTAHNTGLTLTLALSYGGRREIISAAKKIAEDCLSGKIKPEDVDEAQFASYLYDPELPDPELLIRTGGEMRVSNFLLWQIAYSEIYVTDTLWPDFGREELMQAISEFNSRERRFGKVVEK
jgi:undecaprenyl diphosphate synthase